MSTPSTSPHRATASARAAAVRLEQIARDIIECLDTDFPAGALALAEEAEREAGAVAASLREAAS